VFSVAQTAVKPETLRCSAGVLSTDRLVVVDDVLNVFVLLFSSTAEMPEWKSVAPTRPNRKGLKPCSSKDRKY
jgi:hypothetical protein